jgi:hypothetical protein
MSQIDEKRKKMIDLVQSLMAKAASSTFPEEAASFSSKAAELMANWSIEEAELTRLNGSQRPGHIVIDAQVEDMTKAATWEQFTALAVANFCGCGCIVSTRKHSVLTPIVTIKICGTPGNISAFEYLFESVIRQARSAVIPFLESYFHRGARPTKTDMDKYYLGFSYGINDQVDKLLKSRDSKIMERGLVVLDGKVAAMDYYQQNHGKVSKSNVSSASFHQEGVAAGRNAKLNKAIAGNSNNGTLRLA